MVRIIYNSNSIDCDSQISYVTFSQQSWASWALGIIMVVVMVTHDFHLNSNALHCEVWFYFVNSFMIILILRFKYLSLNFMYILWHCMSEMKGMPKCTTLDFLMNGKSERPQFFKLFYELNLDNQADLNHQHRI